MSRRLDVINLDDPAQKPGPKMMSSCETGGCGGGLEPLIPPPLVSGRDLIAMGLRPGPAFKELLDTVQTEQLEGRILDREAALRYLDDLLRETSA